MGEPSRCRLCQNVQRTELVSVHKREDDKETHSHAPFPADPIADSDVPAAFWRVPYDAERFGVRDVAAGANCQAFAYALLRHFGRDVSDFRSSDLWEDTRETERVAELAPLDLLLFNRTADPYG